jgi:glycosyltransferase involved in cell wall biosynthesis
LKILLVGPLLPPIHGQSLAFTRFYESIVSDEKLCISTNMEHKSTFMKFIGTFKIFFMIFYRITFYKIDIIYFTCSRSFLGSLKDILLINLATLNNIKLVNHLHGSDFYDFLYSSPSWYKKILFNSYAKVDTSIVLLDSMKKEFKDFKNMKIEVVPNFYDNELNEIINEKQKNKINLLYLSNIIKSKGVFELIDAFEVLCKKYDIITLYIAGGFMADEYMSIEEVKQAFYDKIKGNDKIKYMGKVFGKEKVKLLQQSDIFLLPSYYKSEAFPISIIEAMRCENAIVTTSYKYLPEIVHTQNGILVEIKSVSALVSGITRLLEDTKLLAQIQLFNKKEAQEKYSLDKYIDRLNKIVLGKV